MRYIHDLKCHLKPFQEMWDGRKTYEIRRDDRGFQEGDDLKLREYDPDKQEYGPREIQVKVTYLTRGPEWGIPEGMVVMACRVISKTDDRLSIPTSSYESTEYIKHVLATVGAVVPSDEIIESWTSQGRFLVARWAVAVSLDWRLQRQLQLDVPPVDVPPRPACIEMKPPESVDGLVDAVMGSADLADAVASTEAHPTYITRVI